MDEQERYILEQLDPVIQRMVHAVLRKKTQKSHGFLDRLASQRSWPEAGSKIPEHDQ